MDMNLSKLQEIVKDREAWPAQCIGWQRVEHNLMNEQQQLQSQRDLKATGCWF